MKLFKFYAGTTISLMLLALTIALMIRYQAYLGYAGAGVVILIIIITGLGVWFLVEKILGHRAARREVDRRLQLEEDAQSAATLREQHLLEAERQKAWAEALRAQGDYLKAQAEAQAMHMSIEQYQAALQAGLHYPGPHGYPVHVSIDHTTRQPQIRPTDYRALLPERVGAMNSRPGDPAVVNEDSIPVAPSFRSMSHLIRGAARLILCYSVAGPVYGTVDDLLSMAVTGKPGRGKTTALMYYVAILLSCGAEVVIWDPHGAMADLAKLNDRELPNMPETARVYYFDRKEDILASLPMLEQNLQDRDDYYRQMRQAKHPHLLLADELPVLADYDEELARGVRRGEEAPSLIKIIRRYVLEARKWRCYFIGSGQSMDAEILPTRVTENLSSRIVFFSSDRRARMAGLENDAIKKFLPVIRRAGSGVMVFDCARFDEPILGAIPMISIEDLMEFLGLPVETEGAALEEMEPLAPNPLMSRPDGQPQLWVVPNASDTITRAPVELGSNGINRDALEEREGEQIRDAHSTFRDIAELGSNGRQTVEAGIPKQGVNEPVERVPEHPGSSQFVPQGDDKLLASDRWEDLYYWYGKVGNVRGALEKMGITNSRYVRHASWILEQRGLKARRA